MHLPTWQPFDRRRVPLIASLLAFAAAALIGFGAHVLVRSAFDRDAITVAPASPTASQATTV